MPHILQGYAVQGLKGFARLSNKRSSQHNLINKFPELLKSTLQPVYIDFFPVEEPACGKDKNA